MRINLIKLTGDNRKKTKNELLREFVDLTNIFLSGNDLFKQCCKSHNQKVISLNYQHAALTLQRTKLVRDYMSYNGFNDEEQYAILAGFNSIHKGNFSPRIRKGLGGQIRALKQGLNYVDEYKYAHMDWNQSPILRESLPCE